MIGRQPNYSTYLLNVLKILDKFPKDAELRGGLLPELRWYIKREGKWVKDKHQRDPENVIRQLRLEWARAPISPACPPF
jgi:hypothetical protein